MKECVQIFGEEVAIWNIWNSHRVDGDGDLGVLECEALSTDEYEVQTFREIVIHSSQSITVFWNVRIYFANNLTSPLALFSEQLRPVAVLQNIRSNFWPQIFGINAVSTSNLANCRTSRHFCIVVWCIIAEHRKNYTLIVFLKAVSGVLLYSAR
jgi:hypothetical protein